MSDHFLKLAQFQPVTVRLTHQPKALKKFPLRSTARMFAIADVIMACSLLTLRYFITTRIVTFPIFQVVTAVFYVLVSSFGIYQIFTEPVITFPFFLIAYTVAMALNLVAGIILALQTFDMGLISDNCGDVEVCRPFVKPIALAGWTLTATTFAFIVANGFMLVTYWQLNSRILDEQEYGYAHLEESLSAAHHHHSHHHYPANYCHQAGPQQQQQQQQQQQSKPKLQTPLPKLPSPRFGNDSSFVLVKTEKLSKTSTPDSSTEYKSFPISPLDIHGTSHYVLT